MAGGLLAEQQRLERTIARIRWAAVALAILLGPQFPSLSPGGIVVLSLVVAAYNAVLMWASSRVRTLEGQRRVAEIAFAADLVALSVAMLLFSVDPYWTTFFIGTLVIVGGAFRFGAAGAYVSAVVLAIAYVGITIFRARAFDLAIEPQRAAFHLSVLALTAVLIDRVLRDDRKVRAEREELIGRLERRVAEDAAIAGALRVVARGPGQPLVPAVLEASRDVFHFDRATVFVADEDKGEYAVVHRLASGDAPPSPRMRIGEGLVGAAVAAGRPLLVPNVLDDPRYVPRPAAETARSVIVVPLSIGGRGVAALSLSRALPDAFGPDDARLAETVGGLIAQVLENERLFVEASEARALRDMDRLKDEFLAVVSHELRTPLTVISGSLELLGRPTRRPPEDDRRLIEQAERHVQRLQRSVEDLLDLAQLQEARIELQREFVGVRAILGEAASAHEPLVAAKGQRLRIVPDGDVPPALVDRRRIQQILGNLVQNANRYAPAGTAIELGVERAGESIRFTVDDEGPGIPPDERERVFDKFYRGKMTKDVVSGTGLGLAIARQLVEMHGGRIRAEERPGGGARFVVEIPHEPVPAGAIV
ncbi:MAG TPA: ATP-binding protein [Candidatus Limnocylindria bacterium]